MKMEKFSKYFRLVTLLIVMLVFCSVPSANADRLVGYVYSKSLTVDYFTIPDAYDDLENTCVEDDYIYILNDTKLQKISLETAIVVSEIQWLLLSSVSEFMRKGDRIFIDATIDAVRTIICVDIATFTELAQVVGNELASNFTRGLENVEYFDCDGDDIWSWAYAFSPVSNGQRLYPNIMRGRYEFNSTDMEWSAIFGVEHEPVVGAGGDFRVVQYFYNASSDSISNFTWNLGATTANFGHWFIANSFYNTFNDSWVSSYADVSIKNTRIGANGDDQMNLQYEFRGNEQWLDVTWGEWGVRDNPNFNSDPSTFSTDDGMVWLDTDDRTMRYNYDLGFPAPTSFVVARFDRGVGFITYISGNFLNNTNIGENWGASHDTWGKIALGRYLSYTYGERTWVAYCNYTDNYPKAEFVLEVGGTDNLEAGTVEFEYDNVTDSRVYRARKNFIAIFTIAGDADNLYVCRNLIDRNLLDGAGYVTPTLSFQSATMYESDGVTVKVQPYLFMGELYYLEADVTNMTYFYLEMDDGVNTIYLNYTNSTRTLNIECDEFVAGLTSGTITVINATAERYSLRWGFILNKNILDVPVNFNVTYYGYNVLEDIDISGVAVIGLRIYNLGGHVSYDLQGDSGRVIGGDWMEVWMENGTGATTGAYADAIYRRLQHVHVLWSLDVENNACFDDDINTGYVYMGIQFMTSAGVWVDSWYVRMHIIKGAVDAGGGGAGKAFIMPDIEWVARDENGAMANVKPVSDYLSGYPECGDDVASEITRSRFYVDLWFNTANSSTTIGGRVNTFYYGMDEGGFIFWTNWSPIMFNISESMMFTDLRDSSGNIINSNEIELMKFWVRVLKVADGTCDSHRWAITNPQFSYQSAGDRMRSLNTPDGIETLVLDMPSSGWLQPIAKAISSIGNVIWSGAFNFIKVLIAGIDTLLVVVGSPVSMSQMIEWIMIQSSNVTAWMGYVVSYVSQMLSIFSRMITVLTSIMTWTINAILWVLVYVVGFPIAVLTFFVQILSGQPTVTFYSWVFDFSSVSGLITGAREIAPFGLGFMYLSWLFWGNISMSGEIDEEGIISRIMQTFGWFRTVYNDVFWIFNRMRNEIISLYNFIRSHIPSLGGGGGEVDES